MSNGIIMGNCTAVNILTASITPAEVATITTAAQTFTVPGVVVGDAVLVNPPAQTTGVTVAGARVSAANTVSITFVNPTAGNLTPAAGTYQFIVFSKESGTYTKVSN